MTDLIAVDLMFEFGISLFLFFTLVMYVDFSHVSI